MSGIPAGAQFVFFDGCRFTPSMLADFQRMHAAFYAQFALHLRASSAIRFESEQEAIFRQRYVPASQVGGRRVYDFRWWEGVLWARISAAGTVAAPDSPQANHVVENTGSGAVDIRDSGADAGVMTAGSVRAKWLRENAHRFNFIPEGYSFGEPWHYKYVGNLWAAPSSVGPVTPGPTTTPPARPVDTEEDEMSDKTLHIRTNAAGVDTEATLGDPKYGAGLDPYEGEMNEHTRRMLVEGKVYECLGFRIFTDPADIVALKRIWTRADRKPHSTLDGSTKPGRDGYVRIQVNLSLDAKA